MDELKFDQRPYKVTYYDMNGEKKTIRRVPPPKLHDMLPTDIVELNIKKNDDFQAGEEYTVKGINPRHPNVIQLEDGNDNSTFVEFFDAELKEMVAPRPGMAARIDIPKKNRYLLWP